ncbi:hypothetical protein MRB53_042060 [Persea americana]|nr:hypothetical protein MRB53_042060 [Persea americana]
MLILLIGIDYSSSSCTVQYFLPSSAQPRARRHPLRGGGRATFTTHRRRAAHADPHADAPAPIRTDAHDPAPIPSDDRVGHPGRQCTAPPQEDAKRDPDLHTSWLRTTSPETVDVSPLVPLSRRAHYSSYKTILLLCFPMPESWPSSSLPSARHRRPSGERRESASWNRHIGMAYLTD